MQWRNLVTCEATLIVDQQAFEDGELANETPDFVAIIAEGKDQQLRFQPVTVYFGLV